MTRFNSLTPDQLAMCSQFQSIMNITNEDEIIRALEANNWNLEDALLSQSSNLDEVNSNLEMNNFEDIPEIVSQEHFVCDDNGHPSDNTAYETQQFNINHNTNEKFVNRFQALHISTEEDKILPEIFIGTLSEAIQCAYSKKHKPLLFYFNNEESQYSNAFAQNIMSNDIVSSIINKRLILFLWDVTSSINKSNLIRDLENSNMESVRVRMENYLDCTHAFPILLAVVKDKTSYEIVEFCEGSENIEEVVQMVLRAANNYDLIEEVEKREHTEWNALRKEQERDYQKSLEADLKKKEEREKLEKEKEEEAKREIEKKKAEELEKLEEERRRVILKQNLPSEPEESDENIITAKFKFPNRSEMIRRFRKQETLQTLVDFLSSEGWSDEKFHFINSDRKKVIDENFDLNKTFEEMVAEGKWNKREQITVSPK